MTKKVTPTKTMPIKTDFFRLQYLQLYGHPVLGNLVYTFSESEEFQGQTYFTVVIGPNGTGKSILLKTLLQIFRQIELATKVSEKMFHFPFGFTLGYILDKEQYEIGHVDTEKDINPLPHSDGGKFNRKSFAVIKGNTDQLDGPIPMPRSYIAQSQLITDKFLFLKKSESQKSRYKYMGIRSEPQIASTQRYIRRSVEFIAQEKNRTDFLNHLSRLLDEFIASYIEPYIVYYTKNTKKFFHPNVSTSDIHTHFKEMDARFKASGKRPPNALNVYTEYNKSKAFIFELICEFCRKRADHNSHDKIKRSPSKGLSYNILNKSQFVRFQEDFEVLDAMRQLGLVDSPEFEFKSIRHKDIQDANLRYSIVESSSGEVHLLTTFIGLLATLQPNSLVVIDEPEISLHPNWQMRFIEFLRTLFAGTGYEGCHFIIATHSHFVVSDLPGNISKIIGLRRNNERRLEIVRMPDGLNTYGWSAEDVLYNVFDVASTRNSYVAREIGEILKVIAKKEIDKPLLKSKSTELDRISQNLKNSDPLKSLIIRIRKEFIDNV